MVDLGTYRIRHMLGHVEIHDMGGRCIVTGDTESEALKELVLIEAERARTHPEIA
jgi:hypothetical protein